MILQDVIIMIDHNTLILTEFQHILPHEIRLSAQPQANATWCRDMGPCYN